MTILKNQNTLLSKEIAREKEQIKETIEALVDENRQLKDALIEAHIHQRRKRQVCSPSAVWEKYCGQKFYSSKDLNRDGGCRRSKQSDCRGHLMTEGQADT